MHQFHGHESNGANGCRGRAHSMNTFGPAQSGFAAAGSGDFYEDEWRCIGFPRSRQRDIRLP